MKEWVHLKLVEPDHSVDIARCNCGKVTTFKCHELWPHPGLVPCNEPLCGFPCDHHRHAPGTMGYVNWEKAHADYMGDDPDGPGFFEWLKCKWRSFTWSDRKKAQWTWDRMRLDFVPPAPLPRFELRFPFSTYKAVDGVTMVRIDDKKAP